MIGFSRALVVSTLLLGVFGSPSLPHARSHSPKDDEALVNWDSFQSLLDTVNPAALHSVLHALSPKFQDGVFSKDRAAIEHVHSENPIIASKLVHLALKRQESNSTTTESSTSPTSSLPTSTPPTSSPSETSTVPPPPGATTVTVAPSPPASATPVETTDGAVVYSTIGGGVVTLTSSAAEVDFTPSTSTRLFYTTAPDGSVHTSTSVVVVNAPITEDLPPPTGAAGAAATTGGDPGLQNSASSRGLGGLILAFAGLGALVFAL